MDPMKRVTVETTHGKTTGSVSYYAAADKRVLGIFQRYCDGKADEGQVINAVRKIAGIHRLENDWKTEAKAGRGEKGLREFEEWFAQQPEEHCRIYGSPEVIAQVILQSKESE